MGKFQGHKYTWSKPFGRPRHNWEVRGPDGGVHFSATTYDDNSEASCGLEFHHARSAGYRCNEAPDHLNCPVIGEPCWHDGTSLYASETLWPRIKIALIRADHDAIFGIIEREYDERIERLKGAA